MSFNSLGLSLPLLKAISKKGYENPSPIQQRAIPPILERKDVLASAKTGTGKTAGFVLPILHILSENKPTQKYRAIRALILVPTRELATQVHNNVREYGEFLNLKSTVVFGGVNQNPQVAILRQGVDILIATPGRLLDLNNQNYLSLKNLEILVLDEADRMLDMGFMGDIQRIIKLSPRNRQNLLFSATFSSEIKHLAHDILENPTQIEIVPENNTLDSISQKVYRVSKESKSSLIIKLISEGDWKQVLVFTRTKHGADKLCEKMENADIRATTIHGNKSQNARTKALSAFKNGKVNVLIATDIAARGLDIPHLPHVINFELPNVPEDYVHRIGRTGRAGASGEAISLVSGDELGFLKEIERFTKIKISTEVVEGYKPDTASESSPERRFGRNNQRNQSRSSNERSFGFNQPKTERSSESGRPFKNTNNRRGGERRRRQY